MTELSYFNLGFRSENILEELSSFIQKKEVNSLILKDALSIVQDCVSIETEGVLSNRLIPSGYDLTSLVPLIFSIYPRKKIDEIFVELKKVLQSLSDLIQKKEIPSGKIDPIKYFFANLSQSCLSNINGLRADRSMAIN